MGTILGIGDKSHALGAPGGSMTCTTDNAEIRVATLSDPVTVTLGCVTALMSLRSRLALARLALRTRADQADVGRLAPVIAAGVDLLVLGASGDEDLDAERLSEFREAYAQLPLLLATANGGCAEQASADVVHLARPGWKLWGSYPRGHQWSLLGRDACDARTVERPGDDWDYLFVGPLEDDGVGSPPFVEAVAQQRPFERDALPWFVLGGFTAATVAPFLQAGARRVALTDSVLDDEDPVALVGAVAAAVRQAWDDDAASRSYRMAAAVL